MSSRVRIYARSRDSASDVALPVRVDEHDALCRRNRRADHRRRLVRHRRAGRRSRARAHALGRLGRHGREQHVLLAACEGEIDQSPSFESAQLPYGGRYRKSLLPDQGADTALRAQRAKILPEPVRDVDHRRDARGIRVEKRGVERDCKRNEVALNETRGVMRAEEAVRERRQRRSSSAGDDAIVTSGSTLSRSRAGSSIERVENAQARARETDLAEENERVSFPRARPQDRPAGPDLPDDRDVEAESAGARDRVPADELHAVLRARSFEPVDDRVDVGERAPRGKRGREHDRSRRASHGEYIGYVGSDELLDGLAQRARSACRSAPLRRRRPPRRASPRAGREAPPRRPRCRNRETPRGGDR